MDPDTGADTTRTLVHSSMGEGENLLLVEGIQEELPILMVNPDGGDFVLKDWSTRHRISWFLSIQRREKRDGSEPRSLQSHIQPEYLVVTYGGH